MAVVVLFLSGIRVTLARQEAEQEREMSRRAEADRLEWLALSPEERYERVAYDTRQATWDAVSAATEDATRAAYEAATADTSKPR